MTGQPDRRLRVTDLPWHPIILALAIVLTFWVDQPVSPLAGIRLVPGAAVVVAGLTALLWLVLRNRHRAGLIASAVIVVLWAKHGARFVASVLPRLDPWVAAVWLAVIGLAILIALRIVLRLARGASHSERTTKRLNLAAMVLLMATMASAALGGNLGTAILDIRAQNGTPQTAVASTEVTADGPDIFVFLLDMYPRADVLAERYGLDNTPFLAALDDRGFTVADDSRTAYAYTHLALPTFLHMDYMERIPSMRAVFEGKAPPRPDLRLAINQNPVFDFLRERGYAVSSVSSGFEDYTVRHVERFWDGGELNEFELQFLESTFLGDVLTAAAPDLASGHLRARIRSILQQAPSTADTTGAGSRLVFVHVPAPHTPIVFGPDGEPVIARLDSDFFQDRHVKLGLDPEGFTEAFRGEVTYLNTLVLDAIDGVLARSAEPPVILVLSDHGPSSGVSWDEIPRDEREPSVLRERIANLFAAYTPGKQDVFPDDVSLVNVFRHLFDAYFGTSLGTATPPVDGAHYVLP